MAAEKAEKKRGGTLKQIAQIYRFTAAEDKALPWLLALAFLVPVILGVVFNLLTHANPVSWIFIMILALMIGFLLATMLLTRRADNVGFKQLEGKPGAAAAVLDSINRAGFAFPREPVWVDPKTKDAIWRGTGRTGVYLIGEGEPARVRKALDDQERKVLRVFPGSKVPVIKIAVGNGAGQVPLRKLKTKVLRQKVKLTKVELDQVNARLRTLQSKAVGLPKGVDPAKMKVNRRALRGR